VIPSDEAAIARGRHLAEAVTLCHGCHGDDLGGALLFEEPGIATVYAPNLTSGRGGRGAVYTDDDFVRAIRHGVNRAGRGMMVMHSDHYQHLGRRDLASLIAYLRSKPPVDREWPERKVTVPGRILLALGVFDTEAVPVIPAELIDHEAPIPQAPPEGVSVAYGAYLVSIGLCTMCHGDDLHGGPPIEPDAPPGPDITVYGRDGGWSPQQFVNTLRTGVTPYGRSLDTEVMPIERLSKMTDEELLAIASYLGSIGGG
jgi:mono/diheme cytochrome c family protein